MKFLILSFFLSSVAFAADATTLKCKIDKYPQEVLSFQMKNLGQKDMEFIASDNETSPVFQTQSKNETIVRLVDTLNGQGGDLRVHNDRIEFFGDSAGIDFAYLILYKNSNYTRGFVRMEFSFGDDKQYGKLYCQNTKSRH